MGGKIEERLGYSNMHI